MAKSDYLQIRITPELKAQLKALAESDGRSVSGYVERLLLRAIQQDEKAPGREVD